MNLPRQPYHIHEGIIETDQFRPAPLFINLTLLEPGREVRLPATLPLFQVQLVAREAHADAHKRAVHVDDVDADGAGFNWEALKDTLHLASHADTDRRARYALSRRKRGKP